MDRKQARASVVPRICEPKAAHTQLGPCCISFLQSFIRCASSCASRCAAKCRQITLARRKTSCTEKLECKLCTTTTGLCRVCSFASWQQQRALPALQFQAHPAVCWPHAFPRPYTSAWSVSPFLSVLPSSEIFVRLAAVGPAGMLAELVTSLVSRSMIL